MKDRIKVLLVDDQDLFREALATLMSIDKRVNIVGSVSGGENALQFLLKGQPDVVLMDIRMPGMDGVETTQRIVDKYPKTKVIALTTFDDDDAVVSALQAGALGYLLKDASKDELFAAIQIVNQGEYYLPPRITAKVVNALNRIRKNRQNIMDSFHLLSRREMEVLELLGSGLSNAEIASQLVITIGTVKNHVTHIFEKLGVNDRMQALIKFKEMNT